MIKLKNLWKIALAAMAMSAMLVACDTETKGGDSDSGSSVSTTGVYTATLKKEAIGTGWGATETQETIKFILAPKTVVDEIKDGIITAEAELFIDANKCYVYANNDVGNGMFTSATVTEGTYVQPAGFEEYTGIAITKDADGNYIVKVDMTKINKDILLAKGAAETKVSDNDPWEAVETITTDYVPMMLGSVTANEPAEVYDLVVWGAGLAIADADTNAFPADVTKEPKLSYNCNDLKAYAGTMNEWNHANLTGKAFTFAAAGGDEFAFTVGGWSYKVCGATIDALDTEFPLVVNHADNIKFADGLLTAGNNYVVTLIVKGEEECSVTVSAAE
jgi:hypothetical protein